MSPTGPSPKSFSGFWKDIFAGLSWIEDARVGVEGFGDLGANHDLNNEAR